MATGSPLVLFLFVPRLLLWQDIAQILTVIILSLLFFSSRESAVIYSRSVWFCLETKTHHANSWQGNTLNKRVCIVLSPSGDWSFILRWPEPVWVSYYCRSGLLRDWLGCYTYVRLIVRHEGLWLSQGIEPMLDAVVLNFKLAVVKASQVVIWGAFKRWIRIEDHVWVAV